MKNIFVYLFAFFSLSAIAQINLSVVNPSAPKPSGLPFHISINYANPSNTTCSNQEIEVNIGSLEYVTNKTVIGSATATVTATSSGNVVKITNIPYQLGSSITLLLGVKFKEGTTCNGTQVTITGKYFECGNLINDADPLIITASSSIRANALITQISSYDKKIASTDSQYNAFCLGKKVRYRVHLSNYNANDPDGLDFNSPTVYVNLPNCAVVKGVYKYNTFETVNGSFNETASGNIKTISWIGDDMPFSSTNNTSHRYDIEVEYPCTNTDCIGDLQLSTYCVVKDCNSQDMESLSPRSTVMTKMLPSCDDSCSSGNGGVYVGFDYNLFCPSSCNTKPSHVVVDFSSANVNQPNATRTYKITIPNGINVISASLSGTSCDNQVQVSYLDQNNYPTNLVNAKHILFKVSCFDLSYNVRAQITFNYTTPQNVSQGSAFVFGALATIDEQTIVPFREFTATINNCDARVVINKTLRKNINGNPFDIEADGVSNDVFVYRIKISNTGVKEQLHSVFIDQLDPRLIYLGGLKMIYTNNPNLASIPLLTNGNSYTLPNNQIIRISKPAVNSTGETLKLDNFNFPCDDSKYLIVEFKVKIKTGVRVGDEIANKVTGINNIISNIAKIKVPAISGYKTEFLVWCQDTQQWYQDYVMIKRNEKTKIKLRVVNSGTEDITLHNILNLRPLTNDVYESNGNPRNSSAPFELNYVCTTQPSIILNSSTSLIAPQAQTRFATNGVDMNRGSLICPRSAGSGSTPIWSNSCAGNSNWLMIEFPQGQQLVPGEQVEVIYEVKATGTAFGKIKNSFATQVDANNNCLNPPIQEMEIEKTEEGCIMMPPKLCIDCSSFELIKNKKYLVSGWVKEESVKELNKQFKNFEKSYISIAFTDGFEELLEEPLKLRPSGEIIDGWQRIIGEFVVPQESDEFYIELVNDSNTSNNTDSTLSYFDDVRIIPSEGNMKSYVYDQKTQRLMAELDENNYSTFYEYDLEGGLIRIKKETEKGVFTIQETRKGSVINKQ
ncbi:PKD domain-containing protein [Flavobacterium psychrophilum]|nr:PKD domain-containing protein [Flavobacterium psychrophilum]